MEIRTLRYFLAVAREGSITRAANFLHLTQPTLSRQMQDLEEELGRPLLIRKSHRVDLTPEGVLLRRRAEEIVAMVDKTEAEFTALEDTVSGDVYIGSGETRGLCPVAKVIRQMRAESPAVRYHLYSGNAQDVTDRLDKGLLDFGIVIEPADISKYDALPLPARDVWGVLMRRDSPLAAKAYLEKADLMDLPLICSRQVITPHPGENAFADWFGADFGKLDIAANYNLVFNAAILVEAGVGYAVTLDGLADTSPESALCFRPLEPRREAGMHIIWKKYQVFSRAAGQASLLPPHQPQIFCVRHQVPLEQPRRVLQQTVQPLQAAFLHPLRGALQPSRVIVKAGAHAEHQAVHPALMGRHPALLLGRAQAHPDEIRLRFIDSLYVPPVFLRGQRPEGRRIHPRDPDPRIRPLQSLLQRRKRLLRAPVKIMAPAMPG